MLERSRSRAMADLIASRKFALARPEEQKLFGETMTLRARIAASQGELFELASAPDAAKHRPRMSILQTQIRNLEADQQKLAQPHRGRRPAAAELVVSEPATLKALQQSMREERYEMLQYLVVESGVILWHIGPDAVSVLNVFLPRTEVIEKVAALQKSLADRNAKFDERTARELFLFLVQPAIGRIRSRAPRHHPARGPRLRAVPGAAGSGERAVPRRAIPDHLCPERVGAAVHAALARTRRRTPARGGGSGHPGRATGSRGDREAVSGAIQGRDRRSRTRERRQGLGTRLRRDPSRGPRQVRRRRADALVSRAWPRRRRRRPADRRRDVRTVARPQPARRALGLRDRPRGGDAWRTRSSAWFVR